jgi:hypothetical protein
VSAANLGKLPYRAFLPQDKVPVPTREDGGYSSCRIPHFQVRTQLPQKLLHYNVV